jgi:hypothetical protein
MGKLSRLRKLEGAVNDFKLEHLRSPSPSINWAYANKGKGLTFGMHAILWGKPKSGKSLIAKMYAGQLLKDDPEAIVLEFNTELRGKFQSTPETLAKFGIPNDGRFISFDVNEPEKVFDVIQKDVSAAIQDGEKVKLIIIDSLTNIQGRRSMNADSVSVQQIGDKALTIQTGLERILPIVRKHDIALISTAHARAEMDQRKQMQGKTIKMANSFAAQHLAEYFIYVERNETKDGRTDLAGEEFLDQETKDFMDKAERTAHKIRFQLTDSSFGVSGRTAEFTLDYDKGLINVHEEIFVLAKNLGIITKPNNVTYQYKDKSFRGLVACLTAIRDNEELQKELLTEIYERS